MESKIQSSLIKQLQNSGCYVIKLGVTNKNGIADILCIMPNGAVEFYEVKQKGKEPEPLQLFRANELKRYGIKTYLYDGTKTEL